MADKRKHREPEDDTAGRSGGADINANEVNVSGDVVGRDKTEINIGRATIINVSRRTIFVVIGIFLVAGLAAVLLGNQDTGLSWATWEELDEDVFGIAVAEFTVGGDLLEAPEGREMSRLVYGLLERDLGQSDLEDRAALTKVGVIRDVEQARLAGERVNADIVLWGWIPEDIPDAVSPNFTLIDDQLDLEESTLVDSLNMVISAPGTIRFNQLTGRVTALSRFILGTVLLQGGETDDDFSKSLRFFSQGVEELEQDLQRLQGQDDTRALGALRETLAIFHTAKGVAYAALGMPNKALASYETALSYDKTYTKLHVRLGFYYYNLRRFDEAIQAYKSALELEEDTAGAHYGLGVAYYELEEYEKAIDELDENIRLSEAQDEKSVISYLVKGYAYLKLGNTNEAVVAFRAVFESQSTSDEQSIEAQTLIATIERPTASATLTPTPTPSPRSTPTPASRATATTQPTSPTVVLTQVPQGVRPQLAAPPQGSTHRNPVTFEWSGTLDTGEEYVVALRHIESGEMILSDRLTAQSWSVELPGERQSQWGWSVSVVRSGLSIVTSEEWLFWLNPAPWPTGTIFSTTTALVPTTTVSAPTATALVPTATLLPTATAPAPTATASGPTTTLLPTATAPPTVDTHTPSPAP